MSAKDIKGRTYRNGDRIETDSLFDFQKGTVKAIDHHNETALIVWDDPDGTFRGGRYPLHSTWEIIGRAKPIRAKMAPKKRTRKRPTKRKAKAKMATKRKTSKRKTKRTSKRRKSSAPKRRKTTRRSPAKRRTTKRRTRKKVVAGYSKALNERARKVLNMRIS